MIYTKTAGFISKAINITRNTENTSAIRGLSSY